MNTNSKSELPVASCLLVREWRNVALCTYTLDDKVGSWSPTDTWPAGRDWTTESSLSTVYEDDGNIRLGIGSFHGGENWYCYDNTNCYDTLQFRRGRTGSRLHRNIGNYLLNCAVCLKMLVTGIGDECVNVVLISKLCGVFSFTLRQLYPSERACGTCWMGGWPSLKAIVHFVAKYLKIPSFIINPLTSNDPSMGRTAPLTSRRCILYIYSTNIRTEYFKHAAHSPFFPLQNATFFGSCIIHILNTRCAKI
jgi:hypothetical protein